MASSKRFLFLPIFFLSLSISILAQETCTGHVYHKGKKIMTLIELFGEHDGWRTKTMDYYDLNNKLIIVSKCVFSPTSFKTQSYFFEDYRIHYNEAIHLGKGNYTLENTKKGKDKNSKTFDDEGLWLSHMAIVPWMQKNLPSLLAGKVYKGQYPVPFLQTTVDVTISKTADKKVNGVDCYGIKFEPSHWLFRLLTDAFYVYLDKSPPHRFLYYQGILIPTDDKGNMMTGHVFFHYSKP